MITEWANCVEPIIRLPLVSLGEKEAVLMDDWHIERVCDLRFDIDAGATTDGASIPRFLWRVCGHPLEAPRVYAATLHDYLYRHGYAMGVSRAQADECYRALLRHFGVAAWRAGTEYYALRWFGAANYRKGTTK